MQRINTPASGGMAVGDIETRVAPITRVTSIKDNGVFVIHKKEELHVICD